MSACGCICMCVREHACLMSSFIFICFADKTSLFFFDFPFLFFFAGKMSLAHIDPSLALGFYCDDKNDFEDLIRYSLLRSLSVSLCLSLSLAVMYILTHTHVCTHTPTHTHARTHTHTHTHTYTHTHPRTNTHTQADRGAGGWRQHAHGVGRRSCSRLFVHGRCGRGYRYAGG